MNGIATMLSLHRFSTLTRGFLVALAAPEEIHHSRRNARSEYRWYYGISRKKRNLYGDKRMSVSVNIGKYNCLYPNGNRTNGNGGLLTRLRYTWIWRFNVDSLSYSYFKKKSVRLGIRALVREYWSVRSIEEISRSATNRWLKRVLNIQMNIFVLIFQYMNIQIDLWILKRILSIRSERGILNGYWIRSTKSIQINIEYLVH